MSHKSNAEDYLISVTDSDGDQVLIAAPIRALDYPSAWGQAAAIALRVCQGSGAMPLTITVIKNARTERLKEVNEVNFHPSTRRDPVWS